uniref:Uncharacterized protein n=1 Tax=viral metagenome TaxID=1070528 RepID=A0A6C0ELW3_9ZZZZ
MGATQSKSEDSGQELKAINILDVLATKYILTQNFQDMKKLGDKEYCNKLVILTSDIIKKFLKEKEITYIAQRIIDGVPVNAKKTSSIIYLSTNKLKQQSQQKSPKEYKRRIYNQDGSYREVVQPGVYSPSDPGKKEKTLLTELDVQNPREKDSMCKGIAKFYIKIAHLFAAILKAVNPIYKYDGHEMSIMNKSKIPKGTNVQLAEVNLCNRRIKTLKAESTEKGKIKVRVNNCHLNRKVTTKQLHENILDDLDIDYGEEVIKGKNLGQEIGVPELEKLYYDIYDYGTGKFTTMSKNSRAAYNEDLRIFYKTFTGKSNYSRWNDSGKKRFSDIPLIAYHDTEQCKDPDSAWQQSYEGSASNPLFVKFADNVKNMLKNTKTNQQQLLSILDKLFVWVETPSASTDSSLENKMVTINPTLTSKSLQSLVEQTRKLIINIYLQCEGEYQGGLKLFEAIVGERMLKNSIAQKESLEAQLEKVIVGQDDPDIEKIVQQNVNRALEPGHLVAQMYQPATAAGGARKKHRSRKKKRK